jgi:hypothetical protein
MLFSPNIAFTSLIKIEGRLREFNFWKKSDMVYEIDVSDDRGDRYYFEMVKKENSWEMKDKSLRRWLSKFEEEIAAEILKNG